jgi:hypothetical protein
MWLSARCCPWDASACTKVVGSAAPDPIRMRRPGRMSCMARAAVISFSDHARVQSGSARRGGGRDGEGRSKESTHQSAASLGPGAFRPFDQQLLRSGAGPARSCACPQFVRRENRSEANSARHGRCCRRTASPCNGGQSALASIRAHPIATSSSTQARLPCSAGGSSAS